jgi:hypothetical protein
VRSARWGAAWPALLRRRALHACPPREGGCQAARLLAAAAPPADATSLLMACHGSRRQAGTPARRVRPHPHPGPQAGRQAGRLAGRQASPAQRVRHHPHPGPQALTQGPLPDRHGRGPIGEDTSLRGGGGVGGRQECAWALGCATTKSPQPRLPAGCAGRRAKTCCAHPTPHPVNNPQPSQTPSHTLNTRASMRQARLPACPTHQPHTPTSHAPTHLHAHIPGRRLPSDHCRRRWRPTAGPPAPRPLGGRCDTHTYSLFVFSDLFQVRKLAVSGHRRTRRTGLQPGLQRTRRTGRACAMGGCRPPGAPVCLRRGMRMGTALASRACSERTQG